jgi:TrmH family RNA methyltransferase
MILSEKLIKLFNSLKVKKYRNKYGLFLAEGEKIICDFLDSGLELRYLVVENLNVFEQYKLENNQIIRSDLQGLKKISELKTVPQAIAAFKIPGFIIDIHYFENNLTLFCDAIQDPGNFGTIIRTADWFGIKKIVCTEHTADAFNPKVVQASMGSVGRVEVHYVKPDSFFESTGKKIPVYGAYLEGEDIYKSDLSHSGIIVIGNEGSGISNEVGKYVSRKLFIPGFSGNSNKAESLNASIAAGIICSEFRRRLR